MSYLEVALKVLGVQKHGDEPQRPDARDPGNRAGKYDARRDETNTSESIQTKIDGLPSLPCGVRLIRYEPKQPPVAIDVCSVVENVPKFIESELRALDSRLNNPWTIHGGFTVPQMLDRLAQAGLEVELEPRGGSSMSSIRVERTTKRQETKGGCDALPPECGK